MISFYKKLILAWLFICTSILYADGATTYISINNASLSEANAGTKKMQFTITLTDSPLLFATVNYTTHNGSATAGSDYVAQTDSVTFLPFQTSKTIEIQILDDTIYEGNEDFYVQISTNNSGYAVSGEGKGYGTIVDDELAPLSLYLYDQSVAETDSNRVIQFTAHLNQSAPAGGVTLTYTTQDNSAVAGSDYVAKSGTLTIPAGQVNGYIGIETIGDLIPEPTENFKLKILSISTGTLSRGEATCTITDDDAIQVAISSTDVLEGNPGDNHLMPFRIYLTKAYPLTTPLTINYQTQNGSVPSATSGSDYTTLSGSVTFNQGDTEKIVNVPIIGDTEIEPDENLKMVISGSSYIIDADSESEILNDDGSYPGVNFTTAPFSIIEGNTSTQQLIFRFTLDKPALAGTSFEYYTQDNEAIAADSDYVGIPVTTYVIPEGETEINIPVTINGDTKIEYDESFWLKIQNEVHLSVTGHIAKGVILNDDGAYPSMTFDNSSYSVVEGDSGQQDINFTMTLDRAAFAGSGFDYTTQDMTAQSSDSDYVAVPVTHFTIPEGATQFTIPVTVNGDTNIESDENFRLTISNPTKLTLGGGDSAIATIMNDDGDFTTVSIAAAALEAVEGDSGTTNLNFTIKLATPATQNGLSVAYQTVDITATVNDNDYQPITPQTVVFNSGEQEKSFSITINGDLKIENDENFKIQLLNPHLLNLDKKEHEIILTILNDDEHSDDPLICDNTMYLSSSINREDDKAKGKMWLHTIDTTKNPFKFLVMNDDGSSKFYNALAFSDVDNYIYGLYKKELVRLSKTGKVISLGNVDGLPDILTTKQLFAGAIYGDYYYVSGPGVDYDKIFKIKLPEKTVSEITLDHAVSLLDFSFTPDGQYLHGIVDGGKLVKIDVNTGTVTFIGSAHTGFQFDSTFSDKNGRFFANDSFGQGFYEFNLNTGEKLFLSDSEDAEFNDGANCLKAALVFTDYGDAPASYGTPRHNIANGIYMGDAVDHDIHAYSDPDALGDDLNGVDDEDGVTLSDGSDLNGSYLEPDTTHELKIKVSDAGYLNAWIDYNINGVFDAGEAIAAATALTAGTHTLSFTIPATVPLNQTSYMRFRFSSTPTLNPTENANDGEVEDYAVTFGSAIQPLRGLFNIERTNSAGDSIGSDARNAWYTQIAGRDFDYAIVFYEEDMSAEKTINNTTIKVELIDQETNTTLYERYLHIPDSSTESRFNITLPNNDLSHLPATKAARFRVTYGVDGSGNIIQADCTGDPQLCFDALPLTRSDDARDSFAIRPESFYLKLSDHNQPLVINRDPNNLINPLRIAAGYDYNLTAIAAQYHLLNQVYPTPGYNTTIDRIAIFRDKSNLNCTDRDDQITQEVWLEGVNTTPLLELNNVGRYTLRLLDQEWTAIDSNKTVPDCLIDDNSTSLNGNTLSGCDIVSKADLQLHAYPYQFNVDFTQNNLPSNSHKDFIYMSQLNSTYNDIAIQFKGLITAESADALPTTNFTDGCDAYPVSLSLDADTYSEEGINKPLQTSFDPTRSQTPVYFDRLVEFNEDNTTRELNQTLEMIATPLLIKKQHFLNDHNGSTLMDLRYNIHKNITQTINPVQITFHNLYADSSDAYSEANQTTQFIPQGRQALGDLIRNFYFSQVAPDEINYPTIVYSASPIIRTPLNVDIFCDTNSSFCAETNVTGHTTFQGSPRQQQGWYLSIDHNSSIDGVVTHLEPKTPIVTFVPNPSTALPLPFTTGRNGMLVTKFISCNSATNRSTITITPSPHLLYHPNPLRNGEPIYTVTCVKTPPSQWTGIGETGNIIETNETQTPSHKMDW